MQINIDWELWHSSFHWLDTVPIIPCHDLFQPSFTSFCEFYYPKSHLHPSPTAGGWLVRNPVNRISDLASVIWLTSLLNQNQYEFFSPLPSPISNRNGCEHFASLIDWADIDDDGLGPLPSHPPNSTQKFWFTCRGSGEGWLWWCMLMSFSGPTFSHRRRRRRQRWW